MTSWLTLQEYSNQHGISISTLRRKIKNHEIEHIFKAGRYLLKAPLEEEASLSKNELKSHYKKLLNKKEETIEKLKADREDLLSLLNFLEKEKQELLEQLNRQDQISI